MIIWEAYFCNLLPAVTKFARETGDIQTLSDVDIKIIALAYMLEAEIHGTSHLREHPPPLREVNVKRLSEAPLPGWGSNVPNLKEWEELDQMSEAGGNVNSRILPLKDLENQDIPMSETNSVCEAQDDAGYQPNKDERTAWEDDENNKGWTPAVSRSTHRRYLRRKARRDAVKESGQSLETSSVAPSVDADKVLSENGGVEHDSIPTDGPSIAEKINSSTDGLEHQVENEPEIAGEHLHSDQANDDDTDACAKELDSLDIKSETDGGDDVYSMDGESSEQSWALRSLSESTVACITSDYAMQNVILQIGLRLLAPGGMQIRQMHR